MQAAARVQRELAAFADAPAPTLKGELRREAASLEAELSAAEALLSEVEEKLQRWRGTCERLRNAHAAALTEGI